MNLYSKVFEEERIKFCAKKVEQSKPRHRRKTSRGDDNISIDEFFDKKYLERNLTDLKKSLKMNQFNFSKLKGIVIPKENSTTDRLITAPTIKDRIIHRSILSIILPYLYKHIKTKANFCGSKRDYFKKYKRKVSISTAIKKVQKHVKAKRYWVLKADIEKFFDRVPKKDLLTEINHLLPDNSLENLLKEIIYFQIGNIAKLEKKERVLIPGENIGVSQGSSLSPIFANIYLGDFDRAVDDKYGDIMIRYVDDLLIFSDSEYKIQEIKKFVEQYLKNIGLNLSEERHKTYVKNLKTGSIEFLGLSINRNLIREKSFKKIILKIQDIVLNKEHRDYKHLIHNYEKRKVMNQKIQGIYNYYKFYHVKKLFDGINDLIDDRKRRNHFYVDIKRLNTANLPTLISQSMWQKYFRS